MLVHSTRPGSAGGHFSAVIGVGGPSGGTCIGGNNVPDASLVPLCDGHGRLLPLRYSFFDETDGLKLMNDEGIKIK
jgi:hypothetical protein